MSCNIATFYTLDTNIQNLCDETNILPLNTHLKIHSSDKHHNSLRTNSTILQNIHNSDKRIMHSTATKTHKYIRKKLTHIKQNIKHIHDTAVTKYMSIWKINRYLGWYLLNFTRDDVNNTPMLLKYKSSR